MRIQTYALFEQNLLGAIAYKLYDFAPACEPRKVETIMSKMHHIFRNTAYNDNERYYMVFDENDKYNHIKDYLYQTLFDIPEFKELNLSQNEFEQGISIDDESRPKFSFRSRYDRNDSDTVKNDFIDLDAFIGEVVRFLKYCENYNKDCFGCRYQGNVSSTLSPGTSTQCCSCIINPNMKNNQEFSRGTMNSSKSTCKIDCPHFYIVCCNDCVKKESCKERCDADPKSCNLKM